MFEGTPGDWVGAWTEKRAALTPDRVALVDRSTGTEFTYAELDRRANRTAHFLRARGVADGGRVAVISRNRPAVFDLFFATAKTGGVLAPLSHRLAAPELGELLGTVDPDLLVVEEPFESLAGDALDEAGPDVTPSVLALPTEGETEAISFGEALPADDSPVASPSLSLEDPHLLLHTGGSTGTPKETVLTHGSILWNSVNTITSWGLRDEDVAPLTFPTFHTGGWNVVTVPTFHMGGTVVTWREVDPADLLAVVDERDATVLVAVPAVLRMLTEEDGWADADLSSLRVVKSGGGPCRESVMRTWWDRGVDLSQGYGLTECGPNNFAMPDDWPREKAHTVGKPVLHADARVVDEDGTPVEAGDIGELELRSPHAAAGYLDAEEESAATFGEWVSTGDLARVDEDGYYSIEGRTKDMFVSGGENVFPAEVEDVVSDHPAVEEVVVVPVPDEQWGEVGKAVVQPAEPTDAAPAPADRNGSDEPLTLEELRSFCDGRIARFKIPKRLAFVDEMPTSGPSKIDREAVKDRFGG